MPKSINDCLMSLGIHPDELSDEIKEKLQKSDNLDEAFRITKEEAKRKQYLTALNANALQKNRNIIKDQKVRGLENKESSYISNLLSPRFGKSAGFSSVESRTNSIFSMVSKDFYTGLENLRTKWAGLYQDRTLAKKVTQELFGKDSGDSTAKTIAKEWGTLSERLRVMKNKYGANIGKLEDWGLPQVHDAQKLSKSGFARWEQDILPLLNFERMDVDQTALRGIYENIVTPNAKSKPVGKGQGGRMLANTGQEERVLHFKDPDGWIKYQETYGNPDMFATMLDHTRAASNDIAMLQVLGPNPARNYEVLKQDAIQAGMGRTAEDHLDRIFNVVSGAADRNDVRSTTDYALASVGGGMRALNTSAKLGSAMVSSLTDLANMWITAGHNNISTVRIAGKSIKGLAQELKIGSGKTTELAARVGLVTDFANASLINTRFGEATTGKFQKMADFVLRSSGLTVWTNTNRATFGLEFSNVIIDNFSKTLDKTSLSKTLQDYGVNSKEWNKLRKVPLREIEGTKTLDWDKMLEVDTEATYKVMEMIHTEMDYAVPTPNARVRAITTWGNPKGTISGELARALTQFKSFPITLVMQHLNRALEMDKPMNRIAYATKVIAATTVLGGVALQMKELIKGKNPREMDEKFLLEAQLQGGALGIYGDLLFNDTSRFGNSPTATLAGPIGSTLEDAVKVLQSPFNRDNTAATMFNTAKNYIPGQNLWYSRLITERYLTNNIQKLIDPEFESKTRRSMSKMRREKKQQYWWKPGDTTPDF